MSDNFAHLHLHTEYSYLDGFTSVWNDADKLPGLVVKRLKEIEQEYCAITDHGVTAGWVRFWKALSKNGIKPCFGVEGYYCNNRMVKGLTDEQKLSVVRGITDPKKKRAAIKSGESKLGLDRRSHFVALAMNEDGLVEIQKTLSSAGTEGFYKRPRWDWELMQSMKNCIISSACYGGVINYWFNLGKPDKAYEEAEKWAKEFKGRFYIELMAIDWDQQAEADVKLYKLAKDLDLPLLITNDSHYAYPADWEAHDILLALQSSHLEDLLTKDVLNDPNRMRYSMHDLYIKSRKEMFNSFRRNHKWMDKKEVSKALDNTMEVAQRCHHEIIRKRMIMPVLKVPVLKGKMPKSWEGKSDLEKYFYYLVQKGWDAKIKPNLEYIDTKEYRDRLKYEMEEITRQGFTPYFLLTHRLMKWSDSQGIVRGPARGSSAGSLVAYLLGITMIDPIPFKLLFSRFIDPNRTDFPDVDMDFEDRRRHEIIQYFIDTYGLNNVAILGNNVSFKPKMALKDIARLYKVDIGETQRICDLVVQRSGADSRLSFCLEDTFKQFPFAQEYAAKYPKVAQFAGMMEGLTKSFSVHAAGVIIADGDINRYTALRKFDKNENFRVAFMDRYDAEDIGILKMDVLGLNTMAIIGEAQRLIKERHNVDINLEDMCRDVAYRGGDEKVYEGFARADTVGIFQFSSPGLTRLSKQLKIDKFSEISDATALHRPGPIHSGAMNSYPSLKFKKVKAENALHPIIAKWTEDTYGVIIYQEQVMQIVRELGDFNWEQTNTVRKVMSKSGGAEYFMKTFWPTWKASCEKKGMDEKTALKAFHKIMSFGSWAFNKSIHKDTKILNTRPNQYAPKWITIEQLYKNGGYATDKALCNPSVYKKMSTLSLDSDDQLRPGAIKDVFDHGTEKIWEIKVESGRTIGITANHRMMGLEDDEITFLYGSEIKVGTILGMDGGYQAKKYKIAKGKAGKGHGWAKGYKWENGHQPVYDGRTTEINEFKAKVKGRPCQRCGEDYHPDLRFEVHHVTRTPPHSKLRWLCNHCHKIEDYELGNRPGPWGKGFPIKFEKVISKKYLGEQKVYDIEMEDSSRPTFVANGFISHNSHSVSYAMVSYMCMWFKVHYPIEYVTAYLNMVNDTDGTSIKEMIKDALDHGISIKKANVNHSQSTFRIVDENIVAGLSDIKGVGVKAVDTVVENQPYKGLLHFLRVIDNRACNKRSVENLIKAGAFDDFKYNKKALLANLESILKSNKKKSDKGKAEAKALIMKCKGAEEYTKQEVAQLQQSVTPISLGKHITEYYSDVIEKFAPHIKLTKLDQIEIIEGTQQQDRKTLQRKELWVCGLLTKVDLKRLSQEVKEVIDSKQEQRYALANLEDSTDFIVLSFKDNIYNEYEQKLFPWRGKVLLINAECNVGWKKLYVSKVFEMEDLRKYANDDSAKFDFDKDYLFQHPLLRIFKKHGGIGRIREKYGCWPLKNVASLPHGQSMWGLGVISHIHTRIIKTGDHAGKEMHIVSFEDDTFKGTFMIFPADNRYDVMKENFFELYHKHIPFLLNIQRDNKFTAEDMSLKKVSISLDKRLKWKELIKTPFKFKE